MSLNNIDLPASVIASLYSTVLIQPDEIIEKINPTPLGDVSLKFLGSNLKNIVVLVNYSRETFINDHDLQFLTKMLEACKLTLGDIALVNIFSEHPSLPELQARLQPMYMILLGVDPSDIQLPLLFPNFKLQSYAGCTYLGTPALPELNQHTEEGKLLKTKLWSCLKQLFGV